MQETDWIARHLAPIARTCGAAALTDDVAELRVTGRVVATLDSLVEGVHFLPDDPIETVARKLVRVNVSDCLAAGAVPLQALLGLFWPAEREEAAFARFCQALGAELDAWGADLVGGDTVRSARGLSAALTLTGQCGPGGPVRRSGGRAGDVLLLTGEIGWGLIGLEAARSGGPAAPLGRYRVPELPPLGAAGLVAARARAALDISDGLLGDAARLAGASQTGAAIDLDAVAFAESGIVTARRLALATAGDDYQLLLAVPPGEVAGALADARAIGLRLCAIGRLTETPGLGVTAAGRAVDLPSSLAWEH